MKRACQRQALYVALIQTAILITPPTPIRQGKPGEKCLSIVIQIFAGLRIYADEPQTIDFIVMP